MESVRGESWNHDVPTPLYSVLASMLGQSIRSDEGKCALYGRLCARDVGKTELWHEESQFSGGYFM